MCGKRQPHVAIWQTRARPTCEWFTLVSPLSLHDFGKLWSCWTRTKWIKARPLSVKDSFPHVLHTYLRPVQAEGQTVQLTRFPFPVFAVFFLFLSEFLSPICLSEHRRVCVFIGGQRASLRETVRTHDIPAFTPEYYIKKQDVMELLLMLKFHKRLSRQQPHQDIKYILQWSPAENILTLLVFDAFWQACLSDDACSHYPATCCIRAPTSLSWLFLVRWAVIWIWFFGGDGGG